MMSDAATHAEEVVKLMDKVRKQLESLYGDLVFTSTTDPFDERNTRTPALVAYVQAATAVKAAEHSVQAAAA